MGDGFPGVLGDGNMVNLQWEYKNKAKIIREHKIYRNMVKVQGLLSWVCEH